MSIDPGEKYGRGRSTLGEQAPLLALSYAHGLPLTLLQFEAEGPDLSAFADLPPDNLTAFSAAILADLSA